VCSDPKGRGLRGCCRLNLRDSPGGAANGPDRHSSRRRRRRGRGAQGRRGQRAESQRSGARPRGSGARTRGTRRAGRPPAADGAAGGAEGNGTAGHEGPRRGRAGAATWPEGEGEGGGGRGVDAERLEKLAASRKKGSARGSSSAALKAAEEARPAAPSWRRPRRKRARSTTTRPTRVHQPGLRPGQPGQHFRASLANTFYPAWVTCGYSLASERQPVWTGWCTHASWRTQGRCRYGATSSACGGKGGARYKGPPQGLFLSERAQDSC